jgi:flap endonuclease-1
MGVNLKDLTKGREITFAELKGKRLAVDAFNILYQFLSTIRGYDGTLLMDSKGNVTSHLSGLFSRSTKLMQKGIRLAFVFDGEAPDLKKKERERRRALKEEAQREYEVAQREGNIEDMKKYAQRTARLDKEMIEEAKKLIAALGMPVIQAPSEGEAQAAYMVKKGDLDAEISQDFDCLLFGVPRFIQNLTISQRRKKTSKLSYETIKPREITLKDTLEELGITHDQLIVVGILVGTDFNVGGVKGIGPKKALSLVKEYGEDFDTLFKNVNWEFEYSWKDVFNLFKNMPVTDEYTLDWKPINREEVIRILVHEHDFNKQRVIDTLNALEKEQKKLAQKGLGAFF